MTNIEDALWLYDRAVYDDADIGVIETLNPVVT